MLKQWIFLKYIFIFTVSKQPQPQLEYGKVLSFERHVYGYYKYLQVFHVISCSG